MADLPRGLTVRRDAGLYGYERALRRAGIDPIAGVDEAGRGACAGPLVAGAAILPPGRSGVVPGLADSKLLTERARERCYDQITKRALAWSVVVVPAEECDRLGMHVANVEALRRAVALLDLSPAYVLTDGFPVDGLGTPGLAVWKGDRVAACIAAASVLAKVTRDRIMTGLHEQFPAYDFRTHKGYITDAHATALAEHGPCPEHRRRFVNVRRAAGLEAPPEVEVRAPGPEVEVRAPGPEVEVRAPGPEVEVRAPGPEVEVRAAGPEVEVRAPASLETPGATTMQNDAVDHLVEETR